MKKYKISLFCKGSESYIYKISEEQKNKLIEIDVEKTAPNFEDIKDILSIDYLSDTDDILLGAYNDPELYTIQVEDEDGHVIWESSENYENSDVNYELLFSNEDILIIEDYIKGQPFFYEIELEDEFNPENLGLIVKDIYEIIEIIVGITYNGEDLSYCKDYGDYWSKGLNYYICKKDI